MSDIVKYVEAGWFVLAWDGLMNDVRKIQMQAIVDNYPNTQWKLKEWMMPIGEGTYMTPVPYSQYIILMAPETEGTVFNYAPDATKIPWEDISQSYLGNPDGKPDTKWDKAKQYMEAWFIGLFPAMATFPEWLQRLIKWIAPRLLLILLILLTYWVLKNKPLETMKLRKEIRKLGSSLGG